MIELNIYVTENDFKCNFIIILRLIQGVEWSDMAVMCRMNKCAK